MSKPQHTSGPWYLSLLGDLMGRAENGEAHHITRCEAIQNRADARLIVSAPDLLNEVYNARQVVEAVIEHLETGEPWSDTMVEDLKSEIQGMSLKIAKATGAKDE